MTFIWLQDVSSGKVDISQIFQAPYRVVVQIFTIFHSMPTASSLRALVQQEMDEIIHNPLKEAILLLSKREVEYILWVCSRLNSSPLATHGSISLYAEANRCIHLSKRLPRFVKPVCAIRTSEVSSQFQPESST